MWFLLLFVVAPIIEVFVLIRTSHAIGGWNTLGLVIVVAFVGIWLIRREGVKVWRRFGDTVRAGQVPSREIADGVCLLIAGALLILPGFVSDVLALLLILPPTRAVARAWLLRRKRFVQFRRGPVIDATYGGPMGTHGGVTDTTATETRGELEP